MRAALKGLGGGVQIVLPCLPTPARMYLYSCRHAMDPFLPSSLRPDQPLQPAFGQEAPHSALERGGRRTRSEGGVSGEGGGGNAWSFTAGFNHFAIEQQLHHTMLQRHQ